LEYISAQACLVAAAAAFNIGNIDALLRLLVSSKSGKLENCSQTKKELRHLLPAVDKMWNWGMLV
jgi:hypothetical protein